MPYKQPTTLISGVMAGLFTGYILTNKDHRQQIKQKLHKEFCTMLAALFPQKVHGVFNCTEPAGSSRTPNYADGW
jgi:hypothetical protein